MVNNYNQRIAYSNVWILLKLLLVMPATNATSEHSFSFLCFVNFFKRVGGDGGLGVAIPLIMSWLGLCYACVSL